MFILRDAPVVFSLFWVKKSRFRMFCQATIAWELFYFDSSSNPQLVGNLSNTLILAKVYSFCKEKARKNNYVNFAQKMSYRLYMRFHFQKGIKPLSNFSNHLRNDQRAFQIYVFVVSFLKKKNSKNYIYIFQKKKGKNYIALFRNNHIILRKKDKFVYSYCFFKENVI